MNHYKKLAVASMTAFALLASPLTLHASSARVTTETVTIGSEKVTYQTQITGPVTTIKVYESEKVSVVVYNSNSNELTIDGAKVGNNIQVLKDKKSSKNQMNLSAAGDNFKLIGTLKGDTSGARLHLAVACAAISAITKAPYNAILAALSAYVGLQDVVWYSYTLYDSNPMTQNWKQYTVTQLYADSNYSKKIGSKITSPIYKVDLPNS
ncbi:hypothetical protein [Brevibacillus brevis]|uniref:hypothetical protein n=1 Tax=Brevibacillus brevis TaxID=1393 RepID=UPI0037C52802